MMMPFLQESRTPKLLRRQELAEEAKRVEADVQAMRDEYQAACQHYRQLAWHLQTLVIELVENPGVPTRAAELAHELAEWYLTQRPPDDMTGMGYTILARLADTLARDVRRDALRQGTA
jgi:hypothetical protein